MIGKQNKTLDERQFNKPFSSDSYPQAHTVHTVANDWAPMQRRPPMQSTALLTTVAMLAALIEECWLEWQGPRLRATDEGRVRLDSLLPVLLR